MQIQKKACQIFAQILREINLKYQITGFCEIERYYGVVWFDGKSKYKKKLWIVSFSINSNTKAITKKKIKHEIF